MPHLVALGEELRRLRTEAGLSRAALAELALINRATVTNIEEGCRRTRRSTLERIAAALLEALPPRGSLEELVEYLVGLAGPALAPESTFRSRVDARRERRLRRKEKALELEFRIELRAAELGERLALQWARPMAEQLLREKRREITAYATAVQTRERQRSRARSDRVNDELARRRTAVQARERVVALREAELAAAPAPEEPVRAPPPETRPTVEPVPDPPGGPKCKRMGCPLEAAPGQQFCPAHQWN